MSLGQQLLDQGRIVAQHLEDGPRPAGGGRIAGLLALVGGGADLGVEHVENATDAAAAVLLVEVEQVLVDFRTRRILDQRGVDALGVGVAAGRAVFAGQQQLERGVLGVAPGRRL